MSGQAGASGGVRLEEGAADGVKVHARGGRIALGAARLRQHLRRRLDDRDGVRSLRTRADISEHSTALVCGCSGGWLSGGPDQALAL